MKKFKIEKLEERIAPGAIKWCGGGKGGSSHKGGSKKGGSHKGGSSKFKCKGGSSKFKCKGGTSKVRYCPPVQKNGPCH